MHVQKSIALCYVLIKQSDSPSPCQFSKGSMSLWLNKLNFHLRSQSLYRKYGPNLPTSLTHRISIRPKAANLGDLMRL